MWSVGEWVEMHVAIYNTDMIFTKEFIQNNPNYIGVIAGERYKVLAKNIENNGYVIVVPDRRNPRNYHRESVDELIAMGLIKEDVGLYRISVGSTGYSLVESINRYNCKHNCKVCNGKCDYWEIKEWLSLRWGIK